MPSHRIPYDRAAELAGGRLVEIGSLEGTTEAELEAALTDRTAMVAVGRRQPSAARRARPRRPPSGSPTPTACPCSSTRRRSSRPRRTCGRSPATSARTPSRSAAARRCAGRRRAACCSARSDFIEAVRANGSPYERLARPMKVGKEEIAGLVRAVELYVAADHDAQARVWAAVVEAGHGTSAAVPGLQVERRRDERGGPARAAAPRHGRRGRASEPRRRRSADGCGTATRGSSSCRTARMRST